MDGDHPHHRSRARRTWEDTVENGGVNALERIHDRPGMNVISFQIPFPT